MIEHQLTASQEDYLEAVYHIVEEKRAARGKDIARRLNVKASSVTTALRLLSSYGLINYSPYDLVTLTDDGLEVAREIVSRHEALSNFLVSVLGVDTEEAEQAACKMEHAVPREIVDRLILYADYVKKCPRGGVNWNSGFGYYCHNDCEHPDLCALGKPPESSADQADEALQESARKAARKKKSK